MAKQGAPVDEETMESTFMVPTIVVNRFVVSTTPEAVRMVFGESRGGGLDVPAHWRVGLSMTPFEAYELKEVLEHLLQPFQAQIDALISQAQAAKEKQNGGQGNQ